MEATDTWLEDCLENAVIRDPTTDSDPRHGTQDADEKKIRKIPSKPHSTPQTLKWLEDNYEFAEGVCIPRNALYTHYLDFCDKNDSQAVNAASFGKIIRQQFPQITTRRLGTRGQSKYHYYGIGVKESSKYYDVIYSKKGIQTSFDGKKDTNKQVVAYSPRSKLGTLLPDFPSVDEIKLPPNIPEEKVATFLMMYRTHCQRILDTVIRANFDEVQSFLLHFWQGMPSHMRPLLATPVIVSLVGVCDSILYTAISGVLMPTVLQALPESLTQVIRKFARQLDEWLHLALDDLPQPLTRIKFELAHRFAQVLRRQTSLNHLCQASRTVIHSADITSQMLDDWSHVDVNSICKQTLYTMDKYNERDFEMIVSLYTEFETLLEEQAPLEAYTDWLDALVDRCVVQPSAKRPGSLRRIARQFLLMWSCFGTRVIRDMTLHSAPSFGSFHLMHLMFDDYVLFLVESLHSRERTRDLMHAIKGERIPDSDEEMILPNPSLSQSLTLGNLSGSSCPSPVAMDTSRHSVIADNRDMFSTAFRNISSPENSATHSNIAPYDTQVQHYSHNVSPPSGSHENTNSDSGYAYGRFTGNNQSMTNLMTSQNMDSSMEYGYGSRDYAYSSAVPQYGYSARDNSTACGSGLAPTGSTEWCGNYQGRFTDVAGSIPHYGAYSSNRCHDIDSATGYAYDVTPPYTNQRPHRNLQNCSTIYPRYNENTSYYGDTNNVDAYNNKRKHVQDESTGPHKRHMTSELDYQFPTPYVRA